MMAKPGQVIKKKSTSSLRMGPTYSPARVQGKTKASVPLVQRNTAQVTFMQAMQGVFSIVGQAAQTMVRAFEARSVAVVQQGTNGNPTTANSFMFANAESDSEYAPRGEQYQQQVTDPRNTILSSTVVINMIDAPDRGITAELEAGQLDYLPRNFRSDLCLPPNYLEGCNFVNVSLGTIYDGGILTHNHFGMGNPPPRSVEKSLEHWENDDNREYDYLQISGASGTIFVSVATLADRIRQNTLADRLRQIDMPDDNSGVILLPIPNANQLGTVAVKGSQKPSYDDTVYIPYILGNPGLDSNSPLPAQFDQLVIDVEQVYVDEVFGYPKTPFQLTRIGDIGGNPFMPTDPVPNWSFENPGSGDSGTGVYNANGELIGVHQGQKSYWPNGWILPGNFNYFNHLLE